MENFQSEGSIKPFAERIAMFQGLLVSIRLGSFPSSVVNKLPDEEPQPVSRKILELGSIL